MNAKCERCSNLYVQAAPTGPAFIGLPEALVRQNDLRQRLRRGALRSEPQSLCACGASQAPCHVQHHLA